MSRQQAEKRKNRSKNSGSLMPNPNKTLAALAKVFHALKTPTLITAWLYLWLTFQLIKPRGGHYATFVYPVRVRSYEPCRAHSVRIYHDGPLSWVEFSMPYRVGESTQYHWQPCPRSLNPLFLLVVRKMRFHDEGEVSALLSSIQKVRLERMLSGKQRSLSSLKHEFERKDNLHRYLSLALATHPHFDNKTQALCTPYIHHQSAQAYLSTSTDRVRYALYRGHNDILERLWQEAEQLGALEHFQLIFTNHHGKPIKLDKIDFSKGFDEMNYLKETAPLRIIHCYYQDPQTAQRRRTPPVLFSHARSVSTQQVVALFEQLHAHLQAHLPNPGDALEHWRHYYNEVTCVVALQFIALTSARPTHGILPLRAHYTPELTLISDKGKLRQCHLCSQIARTLVRYQDFQASLLIHYGIAPTKRPDSMAFIISETHTLIPLTASHLRHFLKQQGSPLVAYQLRHHFAQFGFDHALPTALIDHLMGHSNFGEGLTDCSLFPPQQQRLTAHLESLSMHLKIQEFPL
ncbi:hypothetical protein ACPV5Q_14115 [Vibrio astriarenae]